MSCGQRQKGIAGMGEMWIEPVCRAGVLMCIPETAFCMIVVFYTRAKISKLSVSGSATVVG